jgi:hypothetical protein
MTIRLVGAGLVSLGPDDVEPLREVLSRYPIVDVAPVFSRPVEELEEDRQHQEELTGTPQPDLTLFFRLTLHVNGDAISLISDLAGLDSVDTAYLAPEPAPPPGPG